MTIITLENIDFKPDYPALMARLRVREGSSHYIDLKVLIDEAIKIAKPKALYRIGYIDSTSDHEVIIDGFTFTSRILRVNLDNTHRVFGYLATCGTEIHAWSRSMPDLLRQFWSEAIAEMALTNAFEALDLELRKRYGLTDSSDMNPGSLEDWPLQEQKVMFAFLGNPREAIGVELTESMLMIPTKSVTGIRFPTEESFASCQLCPREICPNRRLPYDSTLYERKYNSK